MKFNIFKSSVIGYKNLVKGSESQDYIDYKEDDKYIICSVADGHSTDFFKHSLEGARFACKASIEVLSENFDMDIKKLKEKLINYEIQKKIESRWRSLVEEHYKKKYSTTLLSVLITDSFILYLKLGDGDIVLKSKDEYKVVINTRNNLTVDSLGREGEYRHIMYSLEKIEENESISIAYSNAFKNKLDLFNSIESTLQEYNKSIFSRFRLVNTYVNYLNSISKNITHDDISIVFIV